MDGVWLKHAQTEYSGERFPPQPTFPEPPRSTMMIRVWFLVALVSSVAAEPIRAEQWTDVAFPIKKHNFGTVAVSAKTEFTFPVYNNQSSPMRIRTVRTSCGCTTPIVKTKSIEPGQSGSIVARFNTDTFRGKRGATLTVIIERPFYSEVRLRVDGYIRKDMVFDPGALEFGRVKQGNGVAKTTKVHYAGRKDWQIVDVQANRPWLIPAVGESTRGSGRATYEITVTVREDAPVGFFQDEVVVITNDRSMPRVPLRVSGQVESPLTISPQAIAMGSLKPGQRVSQKMIVLGQEPFVIESITADGWEIEYTSSTDPKKTHILLAEFKQAGDAIGPQKATIEITTVGDSSFTAKAMLTADIRNQ
jgi:hypothetical protein